MKKRERILALLEAPDNGLNPYYSGFFERFNSHEFFEAHDVLEQLWLKDKAGSNGAFYKGLIQLAGAFVHVQKQRTRPAIALLNLAETNLGQYPTVHERLNLRCVVKIITLWKNALSEDTATLPALPQLLLEVEHP